MARVFAWIALRLTIATAVQDGTAVAPNPFDAPTNKRRERKHTHAESAACYGRRYPDLAYAFCKDECDVRKLHDHFRDHGRREGRRFGCEAAPLTAAETAKWKVHEARLRAGDEAQAARARARAGLDRVEKEDIVSAAPEPPPGPLGLADRLEKLRGSHMHEAGQRRGHPRGRTAAAPLRTILTNLTEHEVRRRALHHSDSIVDVLHS